MTPGSCPSDTSAHPRSHGENAVAARMDRQQIGSSPLTRGKREYITARARDWGLIPAHAGKTCRLPRVSPRPWAHPRSRGENVIGTFVAGFKTGSSPLTQGKPADDNRPPDSHRLIPAHAGKTNSAGLYPISLPAHPRSRGENEFGWPLPDLTSGSSPLTQGKRWRRRWRVSRRGLIPAHAGKTCPALSTGSGRRAHPRSRGENFQAKTIPARGPGSSPLTRGKPCSPLRRSRSTRLIPAHAGKTALKGERDPIERAHPRSRGENTPIAVKVRVPSGSSPLTRGKHE